MDVTVGVLCEDQKGAANQIYWKQRCERPRFGQSPFATFLHESTHPEKKYGCTCHFNIASPTGKPQEQNSLHKIKLHNWKPKKQKKTKKTKIPEKGWGAHSCWIFCFFGFFPHLPGEGC